LRNQAVLQISTALNSMVLIEAANATEIKRLVMKVMIFPL
jgi:hypothetical protein